MSGDRGVFGSDVSLAAVAHELRRDAEAIERLVGALT